ncbi:hypothetical protein CDAR_99031 [Caerostris darwini]|uniref:Uncharacterized protein n=1 Tax=Caerostris darwini TaxID=1538125 RepID=A0AAV4Q439_9ARAC|nr:hypothetical protein CDAR_99031 [Caerostris darwini]
MEGQLSSKWMVGTSGSNTMEWTALSAVVIGYLLQIGRRSCEGDGSSPFQICVCDTHMTDNAQATDISIPLNLSTRTELLSAFYTQRALPYFSEICISKHDGPFACVNRPESSATCEAFQQVISHRGFGRR